MFEDFFQKGILGEQIDSAKPQQNMLHACVAACPQWKESESAARALYIC